MSAIVGRSTSWADASDSDDEPPVVGRRPFSNVGDDFFDQPELTTDSPHQPDAAADRSSHDRSGRRGGSSNNHSRNRDRGDRGDRGGSSSANRWRGGQRVGGGGDGGGGRYRDGFRNFTRDGGGDGGRGNDKPDNDKPDPSKPIPYPTRPPYVAFVGNLHGNKTSPPVREDDLKKFFDDMEDIEVAEVWLPQTSNSGGAQYGFVELRTLENLKVRLCICIFFFFICTYPFQALLLTPLSLSLSLSLLLVLGQKTLIEKARSNNDIIEYDSDRQFKIAISTNTTSRKRGGRKIGNPNKGRDGSGRGGGKDALAPPPQNSTRPKLQLQARTKPADADADASGATSSNSSIFGGAKPRDGKTFEFASKERPGGGNGRKDDKKHREGAHGKNGNRKGKERSKNGRNGQHGQQKQAAAATPAAPASAPVAAAKKSDAKIQNGFAALGFGDDSDSD